MKRIVKAVCVVVLLVLAQISGAQTRTVIDMNADLRLSDDDAHNLELQAADGSADAATRLFQYYAYYRQDQGAAIKWMTVAAENGDRFSYCNLATLLRTEKDEYFQRRAAFWKKKCESAD